MTITPCPAKNCGMPLHRRTNQFDPAKIFLVCPNCGRLWNVPVNSQLPTPQNEVKDEETIRRALDGMRL